MVAVRSSDAPAARRGLPDAAVDGRDRPDGLTEDALRDGRPGQDVLRCAGGQPPPGWDKGGGTFVPVCTH